jgi:hypothetical protein
MSDENEGVGQPTGAHSLNLCGAGEGKAWKQDRARFPGVNDGKKQVLQTPAIEGDKGNEGFYLDYTIVRGPRGGRRKVLVGGMLAHEHSLTKPNLAKAYAEFAAACKDPEIAQYAKVQAMAKSPQADGLGNKFAAYRDRPKRFEREPEDKALEGGPVQVCEPYIAMHGQDCWCFTCLASRG